MVILQISYTFTKVFDDFQQLLEFPMISINCIGIVQYERELGRGHDYAQGNSSRHVTSRRVTSRHVTLQLAAARRGWIPCFSDTSDFFKKLVVNSNEIEQE